MPASNEQLAELALRFMAVLNGRDFVAARELYSADAVYASAALIDQGHPQGRLVGADRIIEYFSAALEGDEDFELTVLDTFTGLDMAVIVSSFEGQTFVDVLRTDAEGRIAQHHEVTPKRSPIDFLAADRR